LKIRSASAVVMVVALAGCASVEPGTGVAEDDGLLASTPLVRSMPVERGEVVEVGRFSQLPAGAEGADGWAPYNLRGGKPTRYHATEVDGIVCMCADASEGQSALQRLIRIDPRDHPMLEWSWRVPRLPRSPATPSPRARLMIAFHGDASKLDIEQRMHLRMAKAMTGGKGLPYASLVYVWQEGKKADSVFQSPFSERVRMVSLGAGEGRLDRWLTFRRNVREDYRRAFGEEPGDIVGVAIYTDIDNDGRPGLAYYGDITFRREPQTVAR
jgi:hypothetical protein